MKTPHNPCKGIILAGGLGTRLYPASLAVSKQLFPVYDKPMIYYALSVLMLFTVRDILIISDPLNLSLYTRLLGDGSQWGINITYCAQMSPGGISQAFIIGKNHVHQSNIALILGDNIFYAPNLSETMRKAYAQNRGASIFCHYVGDPSRYGVVTTDAQDKILYIEEKPMQPKSNLAVVGLYFYDNRVLEIAAELRPSARGELEITDINNIYLAMGDLNLTKLNADTIWLDTGTYESLLQASITIKRIEESAAIKIACLEEISFNNGWISAEQVLRAANVLKNSSYGKYLWHLIAGVNSVVV